MSDKHIGESWGNTCIGDEGLGRWRIRKPSFKKFTKAVKKVAKKAGGEAKAMGRRIAPKGAGFGRTLRAVASVGLSETKAGKKVVGVGTKVAKAVGLKKIDELISKAMKWFKGKIDKVVSGLKSKALNSIIANVRKSVGLGEDGEDLGYLGEDVDTQKMDKFIVNKSKDYLLAKTPEIAVTTASTVAAAQFSVGTAAAATAGAGAAPAAAAAMPTATSTLTAYFGNLAKDGALKVGKQVADAKTGGKFSKAEKMYSAGGNLYQKIDSGKVPSVSDIKATDIKIPQNKIAKEAENRASKAISKAITPKQPRTDTVVAPVVSQRARETVVSLQPKDVVATSENDSTLVSSSSIVTKEVDKGFSPGKDDAFAPAKKNGV